ncbi:MAG: hypothetical protein A2V90_00865 [Gammaproteobacteria bacterium RBG_16_57_12]|nr:MAG: hypothetical protein A2V90_00865 [Gammaproteobacteria bacterium RBG_16_57_12]
MNINRLQRPRLLATAVLLSALCPLPAFALELDIGIKVGDGAQDRREVHEKGGPPAHAPAHGYRARHHYHYYPSSDVYFDSARGVYFYISDNNWQMSATLPLTLKARLGDHVTIEMDSEHPYSEHKAHKSKYPPGQTKNKDKHKEKHQ